VSEAEDRITATSAHLSAHFAEVDQGFGLLFTLPVRSRCYDLAAQDAIGRMARDAVELSDQQDVYFNVNVLGRAVASDKRGSVDDGDFSAVVAFVVDIDIDPKRPDKPHSLEDAKAFIGELPAPPSRIVLSGGGAHLYWQFREPLDVTDHESLAEVRALSAAWLALAKRIAARRGWTLDGVADLARLLRPGGTLNWKLVKDGGETRPVSVAKETDRRYLLSDLDDLLPDDVASDFQGQATAPKPGELVLTPEERLALYEPILPYWSDGARHQAAMHLSGWFATSGVTESSALEVIAEASAAAGDLAGSCACAETFARAISAARAEARRSPPGRRSEIPAVRCGSRAHPGPRAPASRSVRPNRR